MKRIKPLYQLFVFIFYFGLSLYIQKDIVNEFPKHIHAWAQCDHYALSQGFINNDFDFFHPETLTSYKQFQSTHDPDKLTRVTSSDFPIVQYTAAVLMKVSGKEEPIVFRVLMLLLASLGLLYLFRINFHFSKNAFASLFLPVLLLFSPVYLDYQVGFLPSMAAMSFLFVGVYYYLLFNQHSHTRHLIWSIVWLSLATAIRTPFAIPLIAVLSFHFILWMRKKSTLTHVLIIAAGFILPVTYFIYNQHLRAEYGSIFLGTPLYARSFAELKSNWWEAYVNWNIQYLSRFQWLIILGSLSAIPVTGLLRQNLSAKSQKLAYLSLIYGTGVFLYLILMSRQLVHHDYYSLDTFIPFAVILASIVLSKFVYVSRLPIFSSLSILTVSFFCLSNNLTTLYESRRVSGSSYPYFNMYSEYAHLNELLERNNISKDAKVFTLDPLGPNMSFLISNRTGIHALDFKQHSFDEMMNWQFDVLILRDDLFNQDYWGVNSEILKKTELLDYGFGLFILRKKTTNGESVFQWLSLDPKAPKTETDYSSTDLSSPTGSSQDEFIATYRDTLIDSDYKLITFSFNLNKAEDQEAYWHIHIHSEKEEIMDEYIQISTNSETFKREIIIPMDLNTWYISSYLYNPNKILIKYQNFEVKYY